MRSTSAIRRKPDLAALVALAALLGGCDPDVQGMIDAFEEPDLVAAQKPDLTLCVDRDRDTYGENCDRGPDCDDDDAAIHPGAKEFCDDDTDRNCSGKKGGDPGCLCRAGETRSCYGGPAGTAGIGRCARGVSRCGADGAFGGCAGEVLPAGETCNGIDDDCNGDVDEGVRNACGLCGPVADEICGNGLDDNCDGNTDEGCGSCDPGCLCMGMQCRCRPPTNQPCYGGPPQTVGVGLCKGGVHDCVDAGGGVWAWGPCRGEVRPAGPMCDGADHDCDGRPDDKGCPCVEGARRACGLDVGACQRGTTTCENGQWTPCAGSIDPVDETCNGADDNCDGNVDEGVSNACGGCGKAPAEQCDNDLDDDCDGDVDEDCMCGGLMSKACYGGPAGTRGVGLCQDGSQACKGGEIADQWGPCAGDVRPAAEVCGNGLDEDCDGAADDGCVCRDGETRPCGRAVGECRPGTETCVAGAWDGVCAGEVASAMETCDGKDNDCDGLVDEGVLTACGQCAPAPCFDDGFGMLPDCMLPGRSCDGIGADPNDPGGITLNESTNQLLPRIYVAVTNKNEVALLDTDTGAKLWQKPSYGANPSRTAVTFDGTVWVGNRCLIGGRDNDFACSSTVHLDLDGNLICRADTAGWIRGVAVDADGNVWAGAYNGQTVYKISGTEVDAGQNPPRCKILGSLPVGVPVYGLAVDGRGMLWTASSPTKKIDTKTIQLVDTVPNPSFYGIAIDKQNRVWFGGWSGNGPMHRIDGDPPYGILNVANTAGVTAVSVHPDGSIWGSIFCQGVCNERGVYKLTLTPDGGAVASREYFADPEAQSNHGVAVDKNGKVWSPQVWVRGRVNRWAPNGAREDLFNVDLNQELYTYSDMTGIQLKTITAREGRWVQQFDSAYALARWARAEFSAVTPPGTSVEIRARAADKQADFAGGGASPWCGPFAQSPADFVMCPFLDGHRWLEIEVKLGTTKDGVRPTVSNVKVLWSY